MILLAIFLVLVVWLIISLFRLEYISAKLGLVASIVGVLVVLVTFCVVNVSEKTSEEEKTYHLAVADELLYNSQANNYELSNVYAYEFKSNSSNEKSEYLFWITLEDGSSILVRTKEVTVIEVPSEITPIAVEVTSVYNWIFERTEVLKLFGAISDEESTIKKSYSLFVPAGSIYTTYGK